MNKQTISPAQSAGRAEYLSPSIEIFQLETESEVMAGSIVTGSNTPGFGGGDWTPGAAASSRGMKNLGTSTSSLEDMINDILTFEK